MAVIAELDPTAGAYDALAPYYDQFTAGYAHDAWIAAIEHDAVKLGLRGHRALDIACGTGNSTAPLLGLDYTVRGCDISPEMVNQAQRKFPHHADRFVVADMRRLPKLGEFDLVLCLDDALNYLLTVPELTATFASVAGLLAPDGIFAFDVNSLSTYRGPFTQTLLRETDGLFFTWRGENTITVDPGELARATVEIFADRGDGLWERRTSRHTQRHHPPKTVITALAHAGLECARVAGQFPGGRLEACPDETRHNKLVYFARRAKPDQPRGGDRNGNHLAMTNNRAEGGHIAAPFPHGPMTW